VLNHLYYCQLFAIVNLVIFATVISYFSELSHSAIVNSIICYNAQSFYDFISHFAIVNSTFFVAVNSVILWFCIHSRDPGRQFATVLIHFMILSAISRDSVSYFATMLRHFAKLLSHSRIFTSHSLERLTWAHGAEVGLRLACVGRGGHTIAHMGVHGRALYIYMTPLFIT
jgi:hypothetical protein